MSRQSLSRLKLVASAKASFDACHEHHNSAAHKTEKMVEKCLLLQLLQDQCSALLLGSLSETTRTADKPPTGCLLCGVFMLLIRKKCWTPRLAETINHSFQLVWCCVFLQVCWQLLSAEQTSTMQGQFFTWLQLWTSSSFAPRPMTS